MDPLRVRLLGGLQVEGRRPVDIGSRKARTVLAALAVAAPQSLSADALAEVLWGDALPARPADQVGVLVSRLRGVLGADRIVRRDAGYALQADWIDVEELDLRAAAARDRLAVGDGLAARLSATMALDLARGPLLPEEGGEWCERPRVAAARCVAAAGLVAAEAALLLGDPLGAAAAAAAALDHDPYDEAALRALMRAHAATGRPASALAAYAEVRARLSEDLGVSPDPATEALHDELLGVEPAGRDPAEVDGWDPLVQRARAELASNDMTSARRDAEEAVRRGGGPGALELAGWVAYYERDFPAALRWAEEAAARTHEEERRASCLTLAGRVRHSYGDLAGAEQHLSEAAASAAPGVQGMGRVWLASVRAHQGRPDESLSLAERGAVDATAVRHPFALPHALLAQAYALGEQGRVVELFDTLDRWDRDLGDLGPVGERFRPAAANFRSWACAAIGRVPEAVALSERAVATTTALEEMRGHALLDLVRIAVDGGEPVEARRRLDEVQVPPADEGTMVWRQHERIGLLHAQILLLDGEPAEAERTVEPVVADAVGRGARRGELQARAVFVEARARQGLAIDEAPVHELISVLAPMAGLEVWRTSARLAAATGWEWLWADAAARAEVLAAACGPSAPEVGAWLADEQARLRRRS